MLYIIREFIKVQPPGGGRLYMSSTVSVWDGDFLVAGGTASAGQVTISRGPWPVWR